MEPKENVDPENFCSEEEFVCLICVKKYKQRSLLKNHFMKIHFGLEDETETTEEDDSPVMTCVQPKPLSTNEMVCKQNWVYLLNLFRSDSAGENAP